MFRFRAELGISSPSTFSSGCPRSRLFPWSILPDIVLVLKVYVSLEPFANPEPSRYTNGLFGLVDLYKRTSIFYLIGVLGSALGGLLGLGFSRMGGLAGYNGWRWIFIMEGILTILIGIAGYVFTVDFPEKAHKAWGFLTKPEADFIVRRINRDRQDAEPENFAWRKFFRPALDLKIWGFALLFL